jgi:hypothetical protein
MCARLRATVLLVALAVTTVACSGLTHRDAGPDTTAAATTSAAASVQRLVCGRLARTECERIVAAVLVHEPAMRTSPIAVVDLGGQDVQVAYASRRPVLVAFEAPPDDDPWMKPPTWVYTEQEGGSYYFVEEWRLGSLPADFTALVRSAGIGS